jgi:hypothetical protein
MRLRPGPRRPGRAVRADHVIPDDDAGHQPEPDCPCLPDIERVDYDLIVVDHKDQDLDLVLED